MTGQSTNCMTYSHTHTGKNALIATYPHIISARSNFPSPDTVLTSKQYPNSNSSPPSPPAGNSPLALLLPGKPFTPGPNSLPTRKYAIVAITRDPPSVCTKVKRRVRRMVEDTELV